MPEPLQLDTTIQSAEKPSGYFRIGFVTLDIPPTDISTNRVINDDQVATLRTGTPMFVKSGQSRWDVTVHWKALRVLNNDGTFDYTQWINLRRIVAIFKASPFVEVENDFLRQHFTNIQKAYGTQRMAFALRQLRVDTDPNTTDVINVTLTMSLFNYAPYSKDFGYVGGTSGISADAPDSVTYRGFIDGWMDSNMNRHPHNTSSPEIQNWQYQDDGVLTIKWRHYIFIPFKGASQPVATSPASAGYNPIAPTPRIPKRVTGRSLTEAIKEIIDRKSKQYSLDPSVVEAQCLYESGGNPNAGRGRTDHGGLGLMQLVASTAAQLGVTDVFDPEQNVDGGCRYLRDRLNKFGTYPLALAAYNTGDAYVVAYRDGKSVKTKAGGVINPTGQKTGGIPPANVPHGENAPKYVNTIMANAGRKQDINPAPIKSTDGTVQPTVTSTALLDVADPTYVKAVQEAINELPRGEWWLDHYTEFGAFFFEEQQMTMASADALIDGDFDMFPDQFSVVMVNNLPLIPLAAMQYPTYQHVGPTDTMITVSMNSVGEDNGFINEPEHPGVQAVAAMVSQLEDQFHNLRTTFRAVSSIHRMQAVFIENKILNLLGIEGTMIRGLSTETVPDSTNLVQAALIASQYENIFEEVGPFQINGITSANKKPLQDLLKSGELNKISKAEQNALTEVKKFADAWAARDVAFLVSEIFSISKEPQNFLSSVAVDSAKLRPDQKNFLLGNLDLAVTSGNKPISSSTVGSLLSSPVTSLIGVGAVIVNALSSITPDLSASVTSTFKQQKDLFPGLQSRRETLASPGADMNYADYLIFTSLPLISDQSIVNLINSQVEARFSAKKSDTIDLIYQSLFDWELLTNPLFSRQATIITNSPTFKNRFNKSISVTGPASLPVNTGHGCYKDLGITDYAQSPAQYFVDYNDQIVKDTNEVITSVLGTANQTANTANQTQGVNGPSNASEGFTFTDKNQGLPGDANSLIRMKYLPAYSMNTAFPTFKLMLIEEDNTGPFFAFDNFYSFASVIDIEVIKYREQPDTAIIQISNLSHLLQHRLYDDTAAGKMERTADRFNIDPAGGLVLGGPAVKPGEVGTGGGQANAGITAGKTAAGIPYQQWMAKDLTEGRGNTHSRIPLKFFALQTGSKIQVRMGFSNNPDALFPVFTGQVTQIDGDDILTLTCQSFQLELMTVPGTTVQKNSRFGFNFLSGGAAFGGLSLSNSGDTLNVMKTMLRAPQARHFGHWQVNSIKDPKIKGFEWTELIGEAMENATNQTISQIGSILQTGYDRSGENILINSVINIDASKTANATTNNSSRAQFQHENPNIVLGSAKYGIDKQSTRSVYEIIRDIGRRWPHFNLMVRDYGFPFGADATLVFAHPLDWYYYRPPLYGDAEKEIASNTKHGKQFGDWWTNVGKSKWNEVWVEALNNSLPNGQAILQGLRNAQQPMTDLAGDGPQQFSDAVQYLHGVLTGSNPALDPGRPFVSALYNLFAAASNWGNLNQGFFLNIDAQFQALYREWLVYLQLSDPAANSSRLRPVRKYHLIDHNHIVHNGMIIDDNMYNAVKIADLAPFKFNQNVPDHHTRVLDVSDQIEDIPNNVKQGWNNPLARSYAQSFLREEVGKMYRGDIILRGVPEIEPYDVLLLNDMSTGMVGPVEVDTVIHSFNLENGFITIVKPRLMMTVNEAVSLNIIQTLGLAWSNASAILHDLGTVFNPLNVNTSTSARLVEGAGAAGVLLGAAALTAWAPPVGLTLAALGLLAGAGLIVFAENQSRQNFFKLMPLSRFGRPWIGGLQGFAISNFAYSLGTSFKWFDAEEITPTIESWNELIHYRSDYIPSS